MISTMSRLKRSFQFLQWSKIKYSRYSLVCDRRDRRNLPHIIWIRILAFLGGMGSDDADDVRHLGSHLPLELAQANRQERYLDNWIAFFNKLHVLPTLGFTSLHNILWYQLHLNCTFTSWNRRRRHPTYWWRSFHRMTRFCANFGTDDAAHIIRFRI